MVSEWEAAGGERLCLGLFGCRAAAEPCGFPPGHSPLEVDRAGQWDRASAVGRCEVGLLQVWTL